ncbi:hypothetical protein WJX84_004088 [Apatococcus fuscideae]|uniref:Uncharacterized protein n=1 Tax=Apatococcus fuscideae TaxID=2026836 RepID=A0AAW1TIU1_9CHLO
MLLSAAANNRTSAIGSHRQACPFLAAAGSLARVDTFSNLPRAEGRVHKGSQNKRRRSSHSHLEPCKGLCPATHSSQRPCRDKHPLKGVCSAFWHGRGGAASDAPAAASDSPGAALGQQQQQQASAPAPALALPLTGRDIGDVGLCGVGSCHKGANLRAGTHDKSLLRDSQ